MDYDITIERPGFRAKHKKGTENDGWNFNVYDVPAFRKYLEDKNPEMEGLSETGILINIGYGIGLTLSNLYYKKKLGEQ